MLKNLFKKINPMTISTDDVKVVDIIQTVINHPNTFIFSRNQGHEILFKNQTQEVNILIKSNQNIIEVNSLENCITYNIKYAALSKIEKMISDHNDSNFNNGVNEMKKNKDKLTDKILGELKVT